MPRKDGELIAMFDPVVPCTEFDLPIPVNPARHAARLRFVCQSGKRYVIKSYLAAETVDRAAAALRLAREQAAAEAFSALGAGALQPVFGPAELLSITIAGSTEEFPMALVFPYRDCGTLERRVRSSNPQALATITEAAQRIAARHAGAVDLAAVHSDGAPHNIFDDWTWFDFSDQHDTDDLPTAKANEVWRFLCGTLALNRRLSADTALVRAFCGGYGDADILSLVHLQNRRRLPLLRMMLKPGKLARFLAGDAHQLMRPRAWRAIDHWLRRQP